MDLTRVCIDTGPLIAFLKGRDPGAAAVDRAVQALDCFVTVVTAYELLFGVARTRRRIGEDALLGTMHSLPVDHDGSSCGTAHDRTDPPQPRHRDQGCVDRRHGLEHELPLFTLNERHFGPYPG